MAGTFFSNVLPQILIYDFFFLKKLQDIPKHSVHTLVFRSLKRTADMFLSDYSNSVEIDEKR